MSLTLKGIDGVSRRLQALAARLPDSAANGLNIIAETTMTDAKDRTPVRYGVLKASGKVADHATARSLKARLSFGTEYAAAVHERTGVRHANGEAKFLEHAIDQTAGTFARDLVALIRGDLR